MTTSGHEWVVAEDEAGGRLDRWLAARGRLGSRSRAVDALERGRIFLDDLECAGSDAGRQLRGGERVRYWADRPGTAAARHRPRRGGSLRIIFEDEALIALDKPAGLLTVRLPAEPDEPSLEDELRAYWRSHGKRSPLVVHRIDRDTSGVVLFAKTPTAWRALKEQFARREPERVYLAVAHGVLDPPKGRWRNWLRWNSTRLRQELASRNTPRALETVTDFAVLEQFSAAALLELRLRTGRRHQIRIQAWHHGHPLVGERMYCDHADEAEKTGGGGRERRTRATPEDARAMLTTFPRQALHARRVSCVHPVTGRLVTFEAELAGDMARLVARLRERAVTQA